MICNHIRYLYDCKSTPVYFCLKTKQIITVHSLRQMRLSRFDAEAIIMHNSSLMVERRKRGSKWKTVIRRVNYLIDHPKQAGRRTRDLKKDASTCITR